MPVTIGGNQVTLWKEFQELERKITEGFEKLRNEFQVAQDALKQELSTTRGELQTLKARVASGDRIEYGFVKTNVNGSTQVNKVNDWVPFEVDLYVLSTKDQPVVDDEGKIPAGQKRLTEYFAKNPHWLGREVRQ